MNPEFMREGTSLRDFKEPPFTVIGGIDARSKNHVAKLYKHLSAPLISMDVKSAEMVKYVCNSFHGLKVVFANEIGNVCKMLGIDSHQVMDVFCRDTKLNVSAAYFKPGFAFGGSCLPKDLRALLHKAKNLDLELPMLRSVMLSNSLQIDRAYEMIRRTGRKRVGILGLTFKANTDDLRESPAVALVEVLLGKGYEVCVYDRDFSMSMLFGANRAFIEKAIPHIASLLRSSVEDVIRASDVVVACTQNPQFAGAINRHAKKKWIVDLVRLHGVDTKIRRYNGICW
jgi:GDP-mannose 6-dehydrogenase